LESIAQSGVESRVTIRDLLEAGVHFGHQTGRWDTAMSKYIFAERVGIHIVDLDQTLELLNRAQAFVRSVAEMDRQILFAGTKKQARLTLADQAIRCGQPYVVERYIGGMLTNFKTIHNRIEHFKRLSESIEQTPEEERSGRQWFARLREYNKLRRNFAGLTNMDHPPDAVFVVDPSREYLLIKEANRLQIPIIGLVDTNCNPKVIDYPIPGNDDAIRSINLISGLIADSILEGTGGAVATSPEDRPVPPTVEEAAQVREGPLEGRSSEEEKSLEEPLRDESEEEVRTQAGGYEGEEG